MNEHLNAKQPKTLGTRLLIIVLFCFFSFGVITANAQKLPTLPDVKTWNLSNSTNKITAYYSPEYDARVADVRPLTEQMMEFYNKELNIKDNFTIVILSKEQWNKYLSIFPYGLLIVSNGVAFIPATADGVLTSRTQALKGKASKTTLKKLRKSGFTFDEGARKYTDLILLHELGHTFTKSYGINTANNQMLTEFLATYFAYAFLKEKHPKLALLFQVLVTDIYLEGYEPKYTSLEDFERLFLNVGADNYSWYQGHFLQKAAEIYNAKGLSFLREMKQAFPVEEKELITGDVVKRLEKLSPGFINWSKHLAQ